MVEAALEAERAERQSEGRAAQAVAGSLEARLAEAEGSLLEEREGRARSEAQLGEIQTWLKLMEVEWSTQNESSHQVKAENKKRFLGFQVIRKP